MKKILLVFSLTVLSFNIYATGLIKCQSPDLMIIISGEVLANEAKLISINLYGTELLTKEAYAIKQIYNSDRRFDFAVLDSQSGLNVLEIETAKNENDDSVAGFLSSGFGFVAGGKGIKIVNCQFIY